MGGELMVLQQLGFGYTCVCGGGGGSGGLETLEKTAIPAGGCVRAPSVHHTCALLRPRCCSSWTKFISCVAHRCCGNRLKNVYQAKRISGRIS